MFNCQLCGVATGPRVSPTRVVVETRDTQYFRLDAEGEPQASVGTEIVKEGNLCPTCAGLDVSAEVSLDMGLFISITKAHHEHARSCKKPLTSECVRCVENIKTFASLPLPALSKVLEQPMASPGKIRLGALAVDAMMRRTTHLRNKTGAARDFAAAYPVLKGYEQRGGGI